MVTYCHHAIDDDLPPPVVMCATYAYMTHMHMVTSCRHPSSCAPCLCLCICLYIYLCATSAPRLLTTRLQPYPREAATLSTRGCNPIHKRLQPYPREAATLRTRGCHPATPCVCPRCVMALVTAVTWPSRAAKGAKKVAKGSKKK